MTNENKHLDPIYIQDLEKKYMEKIWECIDSEIFDYTLENVSKKISENINDWKTKFDMKNFFNIPFERICIVAPTKCGLLSYRAQKLQSVPL